MVDFTLTYVDAKKRQVVLVEDFHGAINVKNLPPVAGKTTQLRIVVTRHELIEKVLIRDAKLDDRVVEYLKIEARYASLRKSMPIDGTLMFSGLVEDDDGKKVVQFQDFAGTADDMFLSFPLGYYRAAAKMLKPMIEKMPSPDNRWLRVDSAYGKQLDRMVDKETGKVPRKKRSRS